MNHHWLRLWVVAEQATSHYLKQWWHSLLTHICVNRFQWVIKSSLASSILQPFLSQYLSQTSLRWRHNGCDGVSNHQPHDCLLNRLFGRRSKKTSKLRVTGLCVGNSPGTGEFPAQMASNAENVSIWWRHHVTYVWVARGALTDKCY